MFLVTEDIFSEWHHNNHGNKEKVLVTEKLRTESVYELDRMF